MASEQEFVAQSENKRVRNRKVRLAICINDNLRNRKSDRKTHSQEAGHNKDSDLTSLLRRRNQY